YRRVSLMPQDMTHPGSVFGDLFVFRLLSQTGAGLPITATLKLTDAVRRALLDLAGESPPDLLNGRGRHPHCAYVALPFVGTKYADGHIMGFALVLPNNLEIGNRRAILRVLGRFHEASKIVIPDVGDWTAEYLAGEPTGKTLNPRTWTRPARQWHSATPVLFDQFPKNGKPGRTAGEIISRSCEHVGLPRPIEVKVSPYASLAGVEPAGEFFIRRRREDVPRYAAHVTLVFEQKVRGPVLLGAGRYFGLGLMHPVEATS
ncbi:MAG TPA: type I-U CRISPR-associated protein Csb2, partial [Blastocatellia bacterium]|nr:type I-U CRISPR-associated protein Csb2 [Blastocatellia bacterium]